MGIRVYNTLSKKIEDFVPLRDGEVRIYGCGMTVQESPHLGHLRNFLVTDVMVRHFEQRGFKVIYVTNFTDVDDKIIEKSREENLDYRIVGERYIEEFKDMEEQLNIKRASAYPRATQYITEIIEIIKSLMEKGFAYESQGDVYFEVMKFNDYGKLSGKRVEDLIKGLRVETTKKKNPLDFALWKAAKEGEPYWYSPWGKGRPGWHIECSAMSMNLLGTPFDIHRGGTDLIFPHHENEIAQSEGATGKEFVRYWIHSEMVNLRGEKMSKSEKRFKTVKELLEKFSPDALRMYLLQAHYRSQIDYDERRLEEAERAVERIYNFIVRCEELKMEEYEESIEDFLSVMDQDFNTPKAISIIFDDIKKGWSKIERGKKPLREFNRVKRMTEALGFLFRSEKQESEEMVYDIISLREDMRREKLYSYADRIRDILSRYYILEDTPQGTRVIKRWK